MVRREYIGFAFAPLQRLYERDCRRKRSVKRFLMYNSDKPLHFLTQTFASSFARDDERAARTRLLRLKKVLAQFGEYLVVWERGDESNHIHAHIIFAELRPVAIQFLQSYMRDCGILFHKPIKSLNYERIGGYLADYVSKDSKYRYTASLALRALPSLNSMLAEKRHGARGMHLLYPTRSMTFRQVLNCDDSGGLTFICESYEQLKFDNCG